MVFLSKLNSPMTVDRKARDALAEILQQLLSGENFDFDKRIEELPETDDEVIEVFIEALYIRPDQEDWCFFPNAELHPLLFHPPPDPNLVKLTQRLLRFLQTDLEYSWPSYIPPPEPFWPWHAYLLALAAIILLIACLTAHYSFAGVAVLTLLPVINWAAKYRGHLRDHQNSVANTPPDEQWPFLKEPT